METLNSLEYDYKILEKYAANINIFNKGLYCNHKERCLRKRSKDGWDSPFPYWGRIITIAYYRVNDTLSNKKYLVSACMNSTGAFFRRKQKFTKEQLLTLDKMPTWDDISLALYKEFAIDVLFPKTFRYYLGNEIVIDIQFKEWAMKHLLGNLTYQWRD